MFDGGTADYLTVGEMPGATPERRGSLTDARTGQLSMVFQFEHVGLDHDGVKWNAGALDIRDLKKSFGKWQARSPSIGWNSLYWNNHDQPRIVSRWGNDREHWYASATASGHGAAPAPRHAVRLPGRRAGHDERAVRRHRAAARHRVGEPLRGGRRHAGQEPAAVLGALRAMSRDNARTPMQWTAEPGAGFTAATPWIGVNPNHDRVNAAAQIDDPNSIFAHYRRLIALRHSDPVVVHGDFRMLLPDDPSGLRVHSTLQQHRATCPRQLLRRARYGRNPRRIPLERHRARPCQLPGGYRRGHSALCAPAMGGARLPNGLE